MSEIASGVSEDESQILDVEVEAALLDDYDDEEEKEEEEKEKEEEEEEENCLLYTSPSPRDATLSRMPSSA